MKRGGQQKKKETREEEKGSISSQKGVGGGKSDMEAGEGNWKGKGRRWTKLTTDTEGARVKKDG